MADGTWDSTTTTWDSSTVAWDASQTQGGGGGVAESLIGPGSFWGGGHT